MLNQEELSVSDDSASYDHDEAIEEPDADDEANDAFLLSERQGAEVVRNARRRVELSSSNNMDQTLRAPTLLGMPDIVLENILHYATDAPREMCNLERVCKRMHRLVGADEFSSRHPSSYFDDTRQSSLLKDSIVQIRRFQSDNDLVGSRNHILDVLGDESCAADAMRTLAADLLSRMVHTGSDAVNFRLRGDTVGYIAELLQSYMVRGLEEALLFAIHSCREGVVMEKDVAEVFGRQFQKYGMFAQSCAQCNVGRKDMTTNSVIGCSCSFPSNSGNVWSWPDDDCRDVLPPEAGRRIIRRFGYIAGVREMVNEAFILAETRFLHAMGVLLVDAYESSVELAKTTTYLDEHQKTLSWYSYRFS